MMKKFSAFFVLAATAFFCVSGCGYTSSSLLPPEQNSIFVDNFKNQVSSTREVYDKRSSYSSYRPGMENDITRAVINQFIIDRHIEIARKEEAALVLKGALTDMRQYPLSYSKGDDVEEFRVEIFVDMELYDGKTGKLLWKETRFMGQSTYTVVGPYKKPEYQAIQDAVKDIAQRIVERTVEHW